MKQLLLLLPAALLLSACSPPSVDSYKNGDREEEIVDLLNQREYEKAVYLIESRDGPHPGNPRRALLLGEAYLGRAGFEPLAVGARVAGPQNFATEEGRAIFPECPEAALARGARPDPDCLMKRVFFNVPEADDRNFSRGRESLRSAYPDPAQTPSWTNALIGAVELASFIKRVGRLQLFALRLEKGGPLPTEEESRWFAEQIAKAQEESAAARARAEQSDGLSRLLAGHGQASWFEPAGGAMRFRPGTGLGRAESALGGSPGIRPFLLLPVAGGNGGK